MGYVVLQHALRLDRPMQAYARWLAQIPGVFHEHVEVTVGGAWPGPDDDPACLATLRHYRSLMPMSQEAHKPAFDLRAADGAIGSQARLVQICYQEFKPWLNGSSRSVAWSALGPSRDRPRHGPAPRAGAAWGQRHYGARPSSARRA